MKKIYFILVALLSVVMVSSCDWMTLDNQESYNAKVHGAFLDSKTGQPVPSEFLTKTESRRQGWSTVYYEVPIAGYANVYEQGWDAEAAQAWNIKNSGEYRNNLVFAGDYRLEAKACNFYELSSTFTLDKNKDNEVNFTVTPYARVLNPTVTVSGNLIKATFKAEYGDPAQTKGMYDVRLCCFTDRFVGVGHNNTSANSEKSTVSILNCGDKVDAGETFELTIDMTDPSFYDEFKYKREHFVRIAVCAVGSMKGTDASGVNSSSKYYNFSPVYRINTDGSVDVVDNWE